MLFYFCKHRLTAFSKLNIKSSAFIFPLSNHILPSYQLMIVLMMDIRFKAVSPEAFKGLRGYINPWDLEFLSELPSDQQHPALDILKVFARNSRMR